MSHNLINFKSGREVSIDIKKNSLTSLDFKMGAFKVLLASGRESLSASVKLDMW